MVSRAVSGDEHWDYRFGFPAATNSIVAIAANNGNIYIRWGQPGKHPHQHSAVLMGRQSMVHPRHF